MDTFEPNLLDHAYVLVILGLVFPLVGWWSYQRFLKRAAVEGERALIREYLLTLGWLASLLVGALAVWAIAARPFVSLVTTRPIGPGPGFAEGAVAAASVVLLVRPVAALLNKGVRDAFAKAFEPLAAFLPKTRTTLALGFVVSIAAGIAEEIAYRGYLLPYLASLGLAWWAALAVGAVLFGLAHLYQGVSGVLQTTLVGAVFGGLYLATGSLLLPIVLHAVLDMSAMTTAYIVLRQPRAST